MTNPSISVINFSTNIDDREAQRAIRAVNRQINEDFAPVWGTAWDLRLHASGVDPQGPDLEDEPVRGEGVLYLVDEGTLPGALGFHAINAAEIPFGFVFTENVNEWTVTLSHEALEMMIDPTANILVPGPDPRDPQAGNVVLHAYEVCDAVERTSYAIDGIRVSNFLTLNWFRAGDPQSTRNDFLGVGVGSFSASPQSHLAFFDLASGVWVDDFLGRQRPDRPALVARADLFEQDKPGRLSEKRLSQVLVECQEKPPAALPEAARNSLSAIPGITRMGRYRAAAERLSRSR